MSKARQANTAVQKQDSETAPRRGPTEESLRYVERLAAEQGVKPITDFESLLGDFWPEDEDIDEFIATVKAWRRGEDR